MRFHPLARNILLVAGLIGLSPVLAGEAGTPYGRYLLQPAEHAGQPPGVCDPGLELVLDAGAVLGRFALLRDRALGPCDMLVYPDERLYRIDDGEAPWTCGETLHGERLHQGVLATLTLVPTCAADGGIDTLTLIEDADAEPRRWVRVAEAATTIPWDEAPAAIEPPDDEAPPLRPYPGADAPPPAGPQAHPAPGDDPVPRPGSGTDGSDRSMEMKPMSPPALDTP